MEMHSYVNTIASTEYSILLRALPSVMAPNAPLPSRHGAAILPDIPAVGTAARSITLRTAHVQQFKYTSLYFTYWYLRVSRVKYAVHLRLLAVLLMGVRKVYEWPLRASDGPRQQVYSVRLQPAASRRRPLHGLPFSIAQGPGHEWSAPCVAAASMGWASAAVPHAGGRLATSRRHPFHGLSFQPASGSGRAWSAPETCPDSDGVRPTTRFRPISAVPRPTFRWRHLQSVCQRHGAEAMEPSRPKSTTATGANFGLDQANPGTDTT
ncbi:hypothetical protein DCS_02009 [Drechmeria coniospora]|uniref:Uncharacterized protein n=1 Tax=Drechmeria coniospora TaxID=98403 RepID=A0A151GUW9_DRECN|nr:hypothetical protein DCS_02009 [Drechmeria coniospora]KYK60871.1 hypothetical protein DCS_02009 [Drechmeria coniospora]